jgi:T5SS/PEP-CTERM-associated repeat protein
MLRTQLRFFFALALLLCAQQALASPTQFFWDNASGGDYATPGNWSPSGPPTDLDDAYFNLGSSGYDVGVSAPTIAREVVVQNDNVNVEIDISLSANTVVVGDQAGQTGNLTVKSGSLESGYTTIGKAAGSQGTLTVDGTAGAASYTNTVDLTVGASGDGTLNVKAGGQAALAEVSIGAGGVGQVTVSGTGSSLTSSGSLIYVGTNAVSGSGTLLVENGATVSAQRLVMANLEGSSATVTVTGAGSKLAFTANGSMTIGGRGAATLKVLDGGTFTHATQEVVIGRNDPGNGSVVVDGAGSTFSTDSHLRVGGQSIPFSGAGGNGSLTVSNGGAFTVAGILYISLRGAVDVEGGTLNVGEYVSNSGTVHLDGTLNGDFSNGGLLTGEGTITGAVSIGGSSTVSPGNSPGTLGLGHTDWNGGGTLKFEINSALGTAGVNWDLLNITGGLDLNATADDFIIDLTSLLPDGSAGPLSDFDPSQTYSWTIAKTTSGITGYSQDKFTVYTNHFGNTFDHYFSVIQVGNDLQLLYSVPEPSTIVSGAIGLALLLGIVRKRRRMRNR